MEKKGKPIFKKWWFWVLVVLVIGGIGSAAGGSGDTGQAPSAPSVSQSEEPSATLEISPSPTQEPTPTPSPTPEPVVYEYDALQSVFLSLCPGYTPEDLETAISENDLFYTVKEYSGNGSEARPTTAYKLAYAKEVAYQTHADEGDYLEVSFCDGTAEYGWYSSEGTSVTAVFFDHGSFWDLSDTAVGDYRGYYYSDPLGRVSDEDGITVVYSNGNEKVTTYFPVSSGEEAIATVLQSANQEGK